MTIRDTQGGRRDGYGAADPFLQDNPFDAAIHDDGRGGGARRTAWDETPAPPAGASRARNAQVPGFIGLVTDEPLALEPGAAPAPRPRAPRSAAAEPAPPAAAANDLRNAPSAPIFHDVGVRDADQPVPRIRIHAACDRRDVARMIQASAGDRRMAKAQISIEMGGIAAAAARFAEEPSPDLLILDTVHGGAELLRGLERLAEVVEPKCKVMILGAANDIGLYRRLMQVGVSEYLVAPLEPVQLIRAIGGLYADPDKPFAGRVAAFLGARGGVGASSLAHNVSWAISEQQGSNVTLVDLDLPFGTAALDFNEDPAQSITDALAAADKLDEMFLDRVVSRPTERLQLFSAPARLERTMELDPEAVTTVLDKIRRTGPHVILDLPHGWNSWMSQTVLSADDIVIVSSPDLTSLRNAKHLVEFATRARQNDAPPLVVLNMVGVPKRPEISAKDFADHVGAPVVAEIPFDPATFGAAMNSGQMLMDAAGTTKTGLAISALATRLTGRVVQPPKKTGLFDKIGLSKK